MIAEEGNRTDRRYRASGFSQRTWGKRAKSVSALITVRPCSTARAASIASGTRLPVTETDLASSAYTAAVRSDAGGIQAGSASSHASTNAQAAATASGWVVTRGWVAMSRDARLVCQ